MKKVRTSMVSLYTQWTDIGIHSYREACRWMLEQMPGKKISGRLEFKDARVTGPNRDRDDVSLGSNSAI